MSGFPSTAFDDESECVEDMIGSEIPPGVAIVEALAAWLRIHGWPCAVSMIAGSYLTVAAAFVWSFWL